MVPDWREEGLVSICNSVLLKTCTHLSCKQDSTASEFAYAQGRCGISFHADARSQMLFHSNASKEKDMTDGCGSLKSKGGPVPWASDSQQHPTMQT